jgi:PIN domain
MPTKGKRLFAVDTSVAVASVDQSHAAHQACRTASKQHRPALSGHAAFETFSVLTRMPGALRVDGVTATAVLEAAFPDRIFLNAEAHAALLNRLAVVGILGGAVYDALVGEVARDHSRILLTRDRRAMRTYDLLGVAYEFVD